MAGVVELLNIAAFKLTTPLPATLTPLAVDLAATLSLAHDLFADQQALVANELTLDVNGLLDGTQDEFITAATPGTVAADDADIRAAQQGYAELRTQLVGLHSSLPPEAFTDTPPSFTPPSVYGTGPDPEPDPGVTKD